MYSIDSCNGWYLRRDYPHSDMGTGVTRYRPVIEDDIERRIRERREQSDIASEISEAVIFYLVGISTEAAIGGISLSRHNNARKSVVYGPIGFRDGLHAFPSSHKRSLQPPMPAMHGHSTSSSNFAS